MPHSVNFIKAQACGKQGLVLFLQLKKRPKAGAAKLAFGCCIANGEGPSQAIER